MGSSPFSSSRRSLLFCWREMPQLKERIHMTGRLKMPVFPGTRGGTGPQRHTLSCCTSSASTSPSQVQLKPIHLPPRFNSMDCEAGQYAYGQDYSRPNPFLCILRSWLKGNNSAAKLFSGEFTRACFAYTSGVPAMTIENKQALMYKCSPHGPENWDDAMIMEDEKPQAKLRGIKSSAETG